MLKKSKKNTKNKGGETITNYKKKMTTSGRLALALLVGWFSVNLSLTLMNKAVFQWAEFHFPITVTLIHVSITGVGSVVVVRGAKYITPAKLDGGGYRAVAGMSVLYTVNILVSNVGLDYVSVSFHQIVRALIPGITVLIQFLWLRRLYSQLRLLSLLPVCVGVALACYGEVDFSLLGAAITVGGAALAAFKGCVTNRILVGPLQLHTLDVLQYLGLLAAVQLGLMAVYTGELDRVQKFWNERGSATLGLLLLLDGCTAFVLNVVSFLANKHTSPVTMTVCGNVKQAVTIWSSILIFSVPVTPLNALGIFITLFGVTIYSYVEYIEKYSVQECNKV